MKKMNARHFEPDRTKNLIHIENYFRARRNPYISELEPVPINIIDNDRPRTLYHQYSIYRIKSQQLKKINKIVLLPKQDLAMNQKIKKKIRHHFLSKLSQKKS
jgi:hypothetical protein